MLKYVSRLRVAAKHRELKPYTPPNAADLERAELLIVAAVQTQAFAEEVDTLSSGMPLQDKHPMSKLSPVMEDLGVICVGGRLNQANVCIRTRETALPATADRARLAAGCEVGSSEDSAPGQGYDYGCCAPERILGGRSERLSRI